MTFRVLVPADQADVYAVRACIAGTANQGQQVRAMEWIVKKACNLHGPSYAPGKDGMETAHHEGRRFVGLAITQLLAPDMTPGNRRAKPKGDE